MCRQGGGGSNQVSSRAAQTPSSTHGPRREPVARCRLSCCSPQSWSLTRAHRPRKKALRIFPVHRLHRREHARHRRPQANGNHQPRYCIDPRWVFRSSLFVLASGTALEVHSNTPSPSLESNTTGSRLWGAPDQERTSRSRRLQHRLRRGVGTSTPVCQYVRIWSNDTVVDLRRVRATPIQLKDSDEEQDTLAKILQDSDDGAAEAEPARTTMNVSESTSTDAPASSLAPAASAVTNSDRPLAAAVPPTYEIIFDWRNSSKTILRASLVNHHSRKEGRDRDYYKIRVGPAQNEKRLPHTKTIIRVLRSHVEIVEERPPEPNRINIHLLMESDGCELCRPTPHWPGAAYYRRDGDPLLQPRRQ